MQKRPLLNEYDGFFYIVEICDNQAGLRVSVDTEEKPPRRINISFDTTYCFLVCDESHVVDYLNRHNITLSGLYELEESELLKWAEAESLYDKLPDVRHYSLVGIDDVVEVIAYGPPEFSTE